MLFHRNPGEWQKVLDDPAKIVNAVEEVLRYWAPSQYQGRFSTGTPVARRHASRPASRCCCSPARPTATSAQYENPDRFDIDREIGLSVGLGHGIHSLPRRRARPGSRAAWRSRRWRRRYPTYDVDDAGCRRVNMANVAGYSNVPVAVGA